MTRFNGKFDGKRKLHKKLPTVGFMTLDKGDHFIWHPKGSYVYISPTIINQYKLELKVDLWNISYDVTKSAAKKFSELYEDYLRKIFEEKTKGAGHFRWGVGGTYNTIEVMIKDADEWMRKLWELCSKEENLEFFTDDVSIIDASRYGKN